jgi:hypothetical protein
MADIHVVDAGLKNADLEASIARLNASGQWKKQRVVWMVPAGQTIPSQAWLAHRSVIFPPNQAMTPILIKDAEVGAAYEEGINFVINHPVLKDWEYLLTVEADNIPAPDGVLKLIAAMEAHPEYHCIGGLYWTKGEGGVPQIWGDITDPEPNFRPQKPKVGEIVECWGAGMGFNLWRMSMFHDMAKRKVPRPWFKTQAGLTGTGTQDLFFWRLARAHGYRCAVDCSTLVGHLDPGTGIVW